MADVVLRYPPEMTHLAGAGQRIDLRMENAESLAGALVKLARAWPTDQTPSQFVASARARTARYLGFPDGQHEPGPAMTGQ
jgi:hypothetical protein